MPSLELALHPDQGKLLGCWACFFCLIVSNEFSVTDPLEHPQFAAVAAVLDQVQRHQEEQLWQQDATSRQDNVPAAVTSPHLPRPLLTKLRKAFLGVHTNKNVRHLDTDSLAQLLVYLRPSLQTAAGLRLVSNMVLVALSGVEA
jgi:hypothetical protein